MKRAIWAFLLCPLSLVATPTIQVADDIPAATHAAIKSLRLRMREAEAVALLRPHCLDLGRITWGGSGNGRICFRVSGTRQFWVDVSGYPNFPVKEIGRLEPLGEWKRDARGEVIVLPAKQYVILPPSWLPPLPPIPK